MNKIMGDNVKDIVIPMSNEVDSSVVMPTISLSWLMELILKHDLQDAGNILKAARMMVHQMIIDMADYNSATKKKSVRPQA